MNLFKIETEAGDQGPEVKNQGSGVRGQGSVVNCEAGFTIIEMIVVMTIMSILVGMAYQQLRSPNEQIACKAIYSAMNLAKMRAVATGYNAYVDFDASPSTGKFFTVYLDTDNANSGFGENPNSNGDNEFTESHFAMSDSSNDFSPNAFGTANIPGVDFSSGGVTLDLSANNPPANDPGGTAVTAAIQTDGVDFNGINRVQFNSKGMAAVAGSVYINNPNDVSSTTDDRGCMVDVLATGIIRMSNWNGSSWSNTW